MNEIKVRPAQLMRWIWNVALGRDDQNKERVWMDYRDQEQTCRKYEDGFNKELKKLMFSHLD